MKRKFEKFLHIVGIIVFFAIFGGGVVFWVQLFKQWYASSTP